jgi:hypothetical protein
MFGRWFNVGLGCWLVASGLFARPGAESLNNLLLGVAIFLVGFLAMGIEEFGRLSAVLGLWAIASPFVLGYPDVGAGLNDLLVGVLVVATSLPWHRRSAPQGPEHRAT